MEKAGGNSLGATRNVGRHALASMKPRSRCGSAGLCDRCDLLSAWSPGPKVVSLRRDQCLHVSRIGGSIHIHGHMPEGARYQIVG
jgi:hypothetical protein